MLESIPSTLFTEWQAFNLIEPFGEWRRDFQSAQICQTLANINRNSKAKSDPFTVTDFMTDFKKAVVPPKQKQASMDELKAKMVAIASAFKTPVSKRTK